MLKDPKSSLLQLKWWETVVILLLYPCSLYQCLPQLRPSNRLSFTNLRDFITQLKTSSSLSRESLDNIKTNIQNLKSVKTKKQSYQVKFDFDMIGKIGFHECFGIENVKKNKVPLPMVKSILKRQKLDP